MGIARRKKLTGSRSGPQSGCPVESVSKFQNPSRLLSWLQWPARLLLASVFLYAGVMKVRNPGAFHEDVLNFQWIDDPLAAWAALALPVLELLCAVAILLPAWSKGAASLLASLLLLFMVALIRAWSLGIDLHCGCFGASDVSVDYPWKLAQNALLLLAAASLAVPFQLRRKISQTRRMVHF